MIRLAFFALLSVALAACGQSSGVLRGAPPSNANLALPAPVGSCSVAGLYTFHGPCAVGALPSAGNTYRLPRYRGFLSTFTFGANNAPAGTTVSFTEATGAGDITGTVKTYSFPLYPSDCAATSCPGKAFLYLEPDLRATAIVKAFSPGVITVEATAPFPGSHCLLAVLTDRTKFGWEPAAAGTAHGKGLRVTFRGNKFSPGPVFLAVACE